MIPGKKLCFSTFFIFFILHFGFTQNVTFIPITTDSVSYFNIKKNKELVPITQTNLGKVIIETNKQNNTNSIFLNSSKLNIPFTSKKYKVEYEGGIALNKNYIFIKPKKHALQNFKTQDNLKYAIKFLDTKCGLPSNKILDIVFDNKNFVWIAYEGGVAKISPNSIYIYDAKAGLPDFPITKITKFDDKILIGTFGGGLIELGEDYYAINNENTGFKTNLVLDIAVCGNAIYVATFGQGLYFINNLITCYKINCPIINNNSNTTINHLSVNEDNLFISLESGFAKLRGKEITHINFESNEPIDNIFTPTNNQLYICYKNEIVYFNNYSLYSFKNNEFNDCKVNKILKGKSGALWLATNKGVFKLQDSVIIKFNEQDGFPDNNITSIVQDEFSNLWFSTFSKGLGIWSLSQFINQQVGNNEITGLFKTENNKLGYVLSKSKLVINDGKTKTTYSHPELNYINHVYYSAHYKSYFIATTIGLFKLTNDNLLKITNLKNNVGIDNQLYITEDSNNNIFISNYNFGLMKLVGDNYEKYNSWVDKGNSLCFSSLTTGNGIWAFCDKGNISFFNNDSIVNYFLSYKKNPIKVYQGINYKNALLLASNIGLLKFENKKCYLLENNYLGSSSKVNGICNVAANEAMATTNQGIFFIKDSSIKLFNQSYGLITSQFRNNGAIEIGNNNYFATVNGVINYYQKTYSNNTNQRKVFIESLELLNTTSSFDSLFATNKIRYTYKANNLPYGLEVPLNLNKIQFRFFTNDWGKEELVKYFYKLEPLTTQWQNLPENKLLLSELPSNSYTLSVYATLADGQKSTTENYTFEILTPFYKKAWFLSMCFGFFIVLSLIVFTQFTKFKFETVMNYGNDGYAVQKARLLAIVGVILMLPIDYYHSEISHRYIVIWPTNFLIVLLCIGAYFYTYSKKIDLKNLNLITISGYLFIVAVLIYRVHSNNYDPILAIEMALTYLFVIFVIQTVSWLFVFSITNLIVIIPLCYISDATSENTGLFISAVIQAFITIHVFY